MSKEWERNSFNMALAPWEEYISIDQNHEILEKENPPFPLLLPSTNREDETSLGLEDNNISHHNIYYGDAAILISPSGVEASNVNAKKEEHNAKERERRMKLSQTYFSLRSLLPNARRSKKRWSSTTIIDKVVDYIPTLEKEIEKLKQKKQDLVKAKETTNNDKRVENEGLLESDNPTISIHQLRRLGEVIIQICINMNQRKVILLSTLIHKAEAEGLRIIAASTVSLCDDHRILTCHLHLQMDRSLQEAIDYESILRKRVISWLC